MRFPRLSLRARLALWHTAILAALLAGSAMISVFFLRESSANRTNSDLTDTWSAFRSELVAEREELPTLRAATAEALNEFRFNNVAVAVFDSTNTIIGVKALAEPKMPDEEIPPPFDPRLVPQRLGARFHNARALLTLADREGGYRALSSPLTLKNDRVTIVVARSLHQDSEAIEEAANAFGLITPLVLALAFVGGWFLAGRSLAPVGAMSERAARISASTTSERLPVANPDDELGRLATVLNDLLDRLAEALAQQRRFMTDASHELRTPVAVVRAVADVLLSKESRTEADYRDALETVHREARRLSRVVDDLFLLSRADIGERPVHRRSLYLDEVIGDASRDVATLAKERGIRVECSLPEDGAPYEGDEELLDRVFGNLIENAFKHGPSGSRVLITLARDGVSYRATVEDEGAGVPAELRGKIFERFFRVSDDEFSVPGAGLGLAIARWAVEAHGGTIDVGTSALGGAKFTVRLPIRSGAGSLTGGKVESGTLGG
jgi:two-component system OmpR family sensor kinase